MISVPILIAKLGLLTLGGYFIRNSSWLHARPALGKIKLAVLPFQNLTGDPNQEYFSDGMTEEMITQLGRLQPERLGVIARTSAMTYKNAQKSTPQICQELGVDYVLEGSVRRADNRARITAQLIQCSDQTHLWADSSERDMVNILSLQGDVAQAIAKNIQVTLTPLERARLSVPPPVNPEAYQAYLKGLYLLSKFSADGAQTATKYLQTAIEKDPGYAPAYAALADCYVAPDLLRNVSPREAFSRARTAATRAVALDDNSAEAHLSLGFVAEGGDWDWATAGREFRRAVALNPNLAVAHVGYGHLLMVLRRPDEAWMELRAAQALDPVSQAISKIMVMSLYYSRKYDDAIALSKQSLEMHPDADGFHYALARSYTQKGLDSLAMEEYLKGEKAAGLSQTRIAALQGASRKFGLRGLWGEWLTQDKEQASKGYLRAYDVASNYAALGDRDQSFLWLEKSFTDRDPRLLYLRLSPGFDSLHSDPRFKDLMRRIGLPP